MRGKSTVRLWGLILIMGAAVGLACPTWAFEYTVGGKPLNISGYVQQSVNYGLAGASHYETQSGFNQFLTQGLLELGYTPSENLKLFGSGALNMDQSYWILSDNSEWKQKSFDKSRSNLFIFNDWQDVVREAHVTYAKDKFYLRVGKQIVQWGETDGFLLTNIINPVDTRRGLADVKFENTILPIWMVRAEYNTPVESNWFKELGVQFILDPNFQFRGNQNLMPGNDTYGAWAPRQQALLGGPYPFDLAYIDSFNISYNKFNDFEPKGMTYGMKVKGNIADSIINLLFYYGRDRDAVLTDNPANTSVLAANPFDGRMVIHPGLNGYYPYFKFVGATFTRELAGLRSSSLGGVAPIIRAEALYAFNSSYTVTNQGSPTDEVKKTDEFRGMFGVDWKFKVNCLNPRAGIFLSTQYFYQKVFSYPTEPGVGLLSRGSVPGRFIDENHKATLMLTTSYMNSKLSPMIFWIHDWTNRGDMLKAQVSYEPSSTWIYTVGAMTFRGALENLGPWTFNYKDYVFGTVGFRF